MLKKNKHKQGLEGITLDFDLLIEDLKKKRILIKSEFEDIKQSDLEKHYDYFVLPEYFMNDIIIQLGFEPTNMRTYKNNNIDYNGKIISDMEFEKIISNSRHKLYWLTKCKFKDAKILIMNNDLYLEGEWQDGIWQDGWFIGKNSIWHKGTFMDGVFQSGLWKDGIFKMGTFEHAIWEGGIWEDGWFSKSQWKNGTWKNGLFEKSTWEIGTWNQEIESKFSNSIWNQGIWNGGKFVDSRWDDGTWNRGEFLASNWHNGDFHSGIFKNSNFDDGQFLGGKFIRSQWEAGIWYISKKSIWENSHIVKFRNSAIIKMPYSGDETTINEFLKNINYLSEVIVYMHKNKIDYIDIMDIEYHKNTLFDLLEKNK